MKKKDRLFTDNPDDMFVLTFRPCKTCGELIMWYYDCGTPRELTHNRCTKCRYKLSREIEDQCEGCKREISEDVPISLEIRGDFYCSDCHEEMLIAEINEDDHAYRIEKEI